MNVNKAWSDAELLAQPPIVVEPGYTDENGVTRNRHLRNPFCPDGTVPKDTARATLANRWSTLHWHAPEETGPAVAADPFDMLRDAIAAMDGTPLFYVPPECGGTAIHPIGISSRDPAAIESWERSAIAMHENQDVITLDAKPSDKNYRPTRLVGDLDDHSAPPRFEDSEESKRMRGLSRGD